MRIILLIIMLSMVQLASAGQVREVDLTDCKNIQMFVGDTLRFDNSTEAPIFLASSLFYKAISTHNTFDFTYTLNENNQYLYSIIRTRYVCGELLGLDSTGNELEIHPPPIAIYPKQYLLSTKEPFNIGIYIFSSNGGQSFDSSIKQLSISVDGVLFFKGDMAAFENFIKQPNIRTHSYGLNNRCPSGTSFIPGCMVDLRGYVVTNFEIPADTFAPGAHIIQAQLTIATAEGGEAVYEDNVEYLLLPQIFD